MVLDPMPNNLLMSDGSMARAYTCRSMQCNASLSVRKCSKPKLKKRKRGSEPARLLDDDDGNNTTLYSNAVF